MKLEGKQPPVLPNDTAMGALLAYVSGYDGKDFQPMNMNFGLMAPMETKRMPKAEKQKLRSRWAKEQFEKAMFDSQR